MASRPLHFIWIADCSGSMEYGGKIQALNNAIREAIPHMREVADENPHAEILVRAVEFSSGSRWHVPQPTPIKDFEWNNLLAKGVTDMGLALSMIADQLKIPPMTKRALPPVLVLISDGHPTDEFDDGLQTLMAEPWGKKSVRIAIAIGEDADQGVLQKFIGHSDIRPLKANNPDSLKNTIRWASTVVLQAASSPITQNDNISSLSGYSPIPLIDGDEDDILFEDVW